MAADAYPGLRLIRHGRGVLEVALNRPERMNAVNLAFWTDFRRVFEQVAEDSSVRAIVVSGGASKHFTAGLDLMDAGIQTALGVRPADTVCQSVPVCQSAPVAHAWGTQLQPRTPTPAQPCGRWCAPRPRLEPRGRCASLRSSGRRLLTWSKSAHSRCPRVPIPSLGIRVSLNCSQSKARNSWRPQSIAHWACTQPLTCPNRSLPLFTGHASAPASI